MRSEYENDCFPELKVVASFLSVLAEVCRSHRLKTIKDDTNVEKKDPRYPDYLSCDI